MRGISRLLSERSQDAAGGGDAGAAIKLFFERLAEAAQALGDGAGTLRQHGEIPLNIGGRQGSAVFGYAVRMGLDGLRAEPFGDAPPDEAVGKPQETAPAARAPIVDVFEEDGEVRIVAELPGVAGSDVICTLQGETLHIESTGGTRYRKAIALPGAVLAESIVQSCHNGILEVRLRRAAAP
jgi:HSP20 family protein